MQFSKTRANSTLFTWRGEVVNASTAFPSIKIKIRCNMQGMRALAVRALALCRGSCSFRLFP